MSYVICSYGAELDGRAGARRYATLATGGDMLRAKKGTSPRETVSRILMEVLCLELSFPPLSCTLSLWQCLLLLLIGSPLFSLYRLSENALRCPFNTGLQTLVRFYLYPLQEETECSHRTKP